MTTPLTPATTSEPSGPSEPSVPVTTPATAVGPVTPLTAAAPVAAAPRRRSGGWVNLLLGAAAILAVGGVAFAAGRATAPAPAFAVSEGGGPVIMRPGGSFDPGTGPGPAGGFLGAGGGLTLEGTVTAIDADSVTVKLASGEEMTFDLDDTTTFHEATDAAASDVQVGDDVAVRANGGRVEIGNGGAQPGDDRPTLTAGDVTVRR